MKLKMRVLDQCDAMMAYVANRGIMKDVPEDGSFELLDLPRSAQMAQPMARIAKLHRGLSRMVEPALPETIEALHKWTPIGTSRFQFIWRGMAPLESVSWLIAVVVVLTIAVVLLILPTSWGLRDVVAYYNGGCGVAGATTNADGASCDSIREEKVLWFYLYFGLLGAFGAAYSAIYDSFSYIREGRYDLRLASTYYVRILLGAFSGILLARPLADHVTGSGLSAGLLAFVGGFSAQLVYKILTKLVQSIEDLFRPDRRKERYAIHEQAAVSTRDAILEEGAARRTELANIIERAQKISDPEQRSETMLNSMIQLISGKSEVVNAPLSDLKAEVATTLQRLDLALELEPKLPLGPDFPDMDQLRSSRERLAVAVAAYAEDSTDENRAALDTALAEAGAFDVVGGLLTAARLSGGQD